MPAHDLTVRQAEDPTDALVYLDYDTRIVIHKHHRCAGGSENPPVLVLGGPEVLYTFLERSDIGDCHVESRPTVLKAGSYSHLDEDVYAVPVERQVGCLAAEEGLALPEGD